MEDDAQVGTGFTTLAAIPRLFVVGTQAVDQIRDRVAITRSEIEHPLGRTVTPQATKLRSALALLCVKSGTVVSSDCPRDALWEGAPPRTARTAPQVYVSKLRKYLDAYAGLADRLITKWSPPEVHREWS